MTAFTKSWQVENYIRSHERDAFELRMKSDAELAAIERQEMAARGHRRLFGEPSGRDELIISILELRYPDMQDAWEFRAEDTDENRAWNRRIELMEEAYWRYREKYPGDVAGLAPFSLRAFMGMQLGTYLMWALTGIVTEGRKHVLREPA